MLLRRISQHVKDQNWFAVAIDFLIVVIGVFIGIQVANWNGTLADAKREAAYVAALKVDFSDVISELEGSIEGYEKIAQAMTLLLEQSRKPTPDESLHTLNEAAGYLRAMEGTEIVSATYSNLIGSGDLSLIQNQKVKSLLASFFCKPILSAWFLRRMNCNL